LHKRLRKAGLKVLTQEDFLARELGKHIQHEIDQEILKDLLIAAEVSL